MGMTKFVATEWSSSLVFLLMIFPAFENFSIGPAISLKRSCVQSHRFTLRTNLPLVRMSGAVSNEDDWYDSEKWESLTKSKARMMNPRDQTSSEDKENTYSSNANQNSGSPSSAEVEWLKLVGCDICIPKDRRRPLNGAPRFAGVLHFIGGVFVGSIPAQTYGPFLEGLTARGRFITVATPCAALSGMDHLKAAYEASLKFKSACEALEAELGLDVFRAEDLPHIGVGHSLGCKVHIILNSFPDCRRSAGRRRSANIFVAYNNFGVKESVPALSELAEIQRSFQAGAAAVVPLLNEIATNFKAVTEIPAIKELMGGQSQTTAVLDFIEKLGATAERVSANAQDTVLDEFSPSPAETSLLLDRDYVISRNLVVKFLDDTIDQSVPLCQTLRARFTAPDTGTGGALQLRRLPGSHVTPNTPRVDADALQAGPLGEVARSKAAELEALCDLVAAFAADEAARAAFLPPELEDGTRIGPTSTDTASESTPPA